MTRIDVGPSATVARARGLPWAGKQEAPSFRAGGAVTGYPGHPVTGGSGHGLPFGCR